jgi:hypothetical protein
VNHNKFRLSSKSFVNRDSNPVYLSCKYLNQGRDKILKILLNCGFKVDKDSLNLVINSNDKHILKMIKNSNGKAITVKGCNNNCVLSLMNLSRIVIRDTFVKRTSRAINFVEFKKNFSILPNNLITFLINLDEA